MEKNGVLNQSLNNQDFLKPWEAKLWEIADSP